MNDSIKQFEIKKDIFINAYSNITFSPEKLGPHAFDLYNEKLLNAFNEIRLKARDECEKEFGDELFCKFAKGLRLRYLNWLSSMSRCASSAIVGGGNFNVARAEKRNAIAMKRLDEIVDYSKNAVSRILSAFEVKTSYRDQKQTELENEVEELRLCNFLNDFLKRKQVDYTKESIINDLINAGFNDKLIDEATWKINQIINGTKLNLSLYKKKIKTIEHQLKDIETMDAVDFDFSSKKIRFENDKENNRFKLFFDEMPSNETTELLKKIAFKYSQSSKAWQAIRTNASYYKLTQLIKLFGN